jgi:hypothetical protein
VNAGVVPLKAAGPTPFSRRGIPGFQKLRGFPRTSLRCWVIAGVSKRSRSRVIASLGYLGKYEINFEDAGIKWCIEGLGRLERLRDEAASLTSYNNNRGVF